MFPRKSFLNRHQPFPFPSRGVMVVNNIPIKGTDRSVNEDPDSIEDFDG